MFTSFDDLAPLLRSLREHAAAGSVSTTYRGTVSPGALTGRVVDHPATTAAGHDTRTNALLDLGGRLSAESALYLDLTIGRGGTATASGALLGASVETGAGHPIATVLLSDALPPPFRDTPTSPDAQLPVGPSDPDLVRRLIAAGAPAAQPASPAELAALESRSGPLPAELRALYETVGVGPVEPGDGTGEAFFGMDVIGLGDDAQRTMFDAPHRNPGWQFATLMMVEPDPTGRVRLFGGTGPRTWVPFADDGGGNQYCVDLAPGPRGHHGQVVLVHHEDTVGAAWVAPSISGFLTGTAVAAPTPQESPLRLMRVPTPATQTGRLAARFRRRTPFDGVTDALEVVTLPTGAGLDLAPLTGCSRLWSLSAPPGSVRDVGDLHRLPRLEHLTLAPADWRRLLDGPGLLPGVVAAGIAGHDHTDAEALNLADAILRFAGRATLERFAVAGTVT